MGGRSGAVYVVEGIIDFLVVRHPASSDWVQQPALRRATSVIRGTFYKRRADITRASTEDLLHQTSASRPA